jgi:anti-sigma B factor antagonist
MRRARFNNRPEGIMDINSKLVEQVTVVEIVGDIDAKSVLQSQERLLPLVQPGIKLLLDMTRVSYMSSSGLRMLLSLYRQVSSNNGSIALANLSDEIKDTMSVTGFLRYFTTYDTVDKGLAAMS